MMLFEITLAFYLVPNHNYCIYFNS
jgi:hypothetical protein